VNQYKIGLAGGNLPGEEWRDLVGVQERGEMAVEVVAALLAFHFERPLEEVAATEMLDDEIKQIDADHAGAGAGLGNAVEQEVDLPADEELLVSWILEDVVGNLVADTGGREEVIGGEGGQEAVQSFDQGIAHEATSMQRRA
jgi:hypothetical protein